MRSGRTAPLIVAAFAGMFGLAGCAETQFVVHTAKQITKDTQSQGQGHYKVGNPYQINGIWYYPAVDYDYDETGVASWYGPDFHGKLTANGEIYDMNLVSAAHRTLPMPSIVQVTNLENGRSLRVRINDRGPFARGRIIDMSRRGAQLLGFEREGTARVRVQILTEESRRIAALYAAGGSDLHLPETGRLAQGQTMDGRVMAAPNRDEPQPAVAAAPRIGVTQASLPPGEAASRPADASSSAPASPAESAPPRQTGSQAREPGMAGGTSTQPPSEAVTLGPVSPTSMYIQAGAFAEYHNANRLKARLAVLGPTQVTMVQMGEMQLFRVRLGPIASLEEADTLLARVMDAGIDNARLIVSE